MKTIKMTTVRNSNLIEKYHIDFENTTYNDWVELTKELLKDMKFNQFLAGEAEGVDVLFHDLFDDYQYNDQTIIETIIQLLDTVVDQREFSLVYRYDEREVEDEMGEYIYVKMPVYLTVEIHKNKRVATLTHNYSVERDNR
jgi:hypothetical protein